MKGPGDRLGKCSCIPRGCHARLNLGHRMRKSTGREAQTSMNSPAFPGLPYSMYKWSYCPLVSLLFMFCFQVSFFSLFVSDKVKSSLLSIISFI